MTDYEWQAYAREHIVNVVREHSVTLWDTVDICIDCNVPLDTVPLYRETVAIRQAALEDIVTNNIPFVY